MSNVVARKFAQVNPDTALLAGLLHGIGKLYLMTRARNFPALFSDKAAYGQIVSDWHTNVAKAILENWAEYLPKFVKVMPVEYRRALLEIERAQAGVSVAAE